MKKERRKPLYTITTTSYVLGKIPKKDIESKSVKNKKQTCQKGKSIH